MRETRFDSIIVEMCRLFCSNILCMFVPECFVVALACDREYGVCYVFFVRLSSMLDVWAMSWPCVVFVFCHKTILVFCCFVQGWHAEGNR